MKFCSNIFIITLVVCAFDITNAQLNKRVELSLSTQLLNGRDWGGVASFSGEINYAISDIYSINGLYRHGSGFGWIGAVEHRTEMDDDVSTYNEISSCFIYNFDDSFLGMYLGAGIGILLGDKQNNENYLMVGVPIVIGSKIKIVNSFKIGLNFIGNINAKTTFTGIGLNLFFNVL